MQLRDAAIVRDAEAGAAGDLALVWRSLVAGGVVVEDHFAQDTRAYLVLKERSGAQLYALSPSKLVALESALAGGALKVAAIEIGVADSTIVMRTRCALAFMGLSCGLFRAPVPLILAAAAAQRTCSASDPRFSRLEDTAGSYWIVSVRRLELAAAHLLSPRESAVVSLLLEGKTHAEIAWDRGISQRTVANQVSAAFRKLHVSGRLELIRVLAHLARAEELRNSA